MDFILVSVFDRVAHTYSEPHQEINAATAVRWFTKVMEQTKLAPGDFDLFKVGTFSGTTGLLTPCELEFIVGGGSVAENGGD